MKQISRNLVLSLMASGLMGELYADSHSDQVKIDGTFTGGILNVAEKRIDVTKTDTAAVCGIMGAMCGPAKSGDYTGISHGGSADSLIGIRYTKNDMVSAYAKFQMSLEKEPLTAKQYYIDVKLGEGTLTVGRASLPYAGIMGAADILTFGVDVPAGASYSSNSPLVSYNTGAMFGPVAVHAALAQASNPGNKAVKTTPVPAIDLAVKVDVSGFRGGLAVHTEETYYSDVTSGDLKPIRPMTFAVHAGYSHDMVHADLSYGTGDPLFTGVTSMAMMDKDLKDKMNSMMFNVGVDLDALSATLFYGNEVAKLSKDYGHMNKKQEIKDVEESATSMGLRLVHAWEGVDWLFEISNTEQKYDSVTFRNRWYAGLGLSTSFNS